MLVVLSLERPEVGATGTSPACLYNLLSADLWSLREAALVSGSVVEQGCPNFFSPRATH